MTLAELFVVLDRADMVRALRSSEPEVGDAYARLKGAVQSELVPGESSTDRYQRFHDLAAAFIAEYGKGNA